MSIITTVWDVVYYLSLIFDQIYNLNRISFDRLNVGLINIHQTVISEN